MAVRDLPSSLFTRAQRLADRVVSPERRAQFYATVLSFSREHPIVAAFIAIQLLISGTPLLIFSSFVLGTLALTLTTAVLFSLFWVGIAMLVLLPTLFVTVSLAIAVWAWAVGSFLLARWVYDMLPLSAKGKAEVGYLNGGKKVVVTKTGEGYGDVHGRVVDGA